MSLRLPEKTRVSVGTASVLGLLEERLDTAPTTAYLMTYHEGKCAANCAFCPQARNSRSGTERLSRVTWPALSTVILLEKLKESVQSGRLGRVCIQGLNYCDVFEDICAIVRELKRRMSVPVSVSCQPLKPENMWALAAAGADRIGIALDAATESLFDKVKGASAGGPYRWKDLRRFLQVAVGIFGEDGVSTHLIVGLGETEKEMVQTIQDCVNMGVLPALFAFTPVHGTAMADISPPKLDVYRRVQVVRHLVVNGIVHADDLLFDEEGRIVDFGVSRRVLFNIVESGLLFQTSGCPNCNRPFYNEKASGPLYNYPRAISPTELKAIKHLLNL